jgi:hypothetical protein
MQGGRVPKLALIYQPMGKRSTGRPKKSWKDQFLEELRNTGLINVVNSSGRRRIDYRYLETKTRRHEEHSEGRKRDRDRKEMSEGQMEG